MEIEMDRLDWDDVKAVVEPVIQIWVSGSELTWAAYAWGILEQHGLTGYTSEVERTRCMLRAVALGALYLDFAAFAFDEGSSGEWRYRVNGDLIGPPPLIDAFTLGQLVERDGIEIDDSQYADEDLTIEALRDLVGAECSEVTRVLRQHCDDAGLFADLFLSSKEDVRYPLSDDLVAGTVNHDVTGDKMKAWEWLTTR
ncbi:hypothetical protein [Actinoplanes sp. NPDC026619]|uniref:hypothetical protein n=1 Tax=Actinoplanes sp. NPDC026619 TaxID=3155798 RepID=UPI00340CED63